MSHIGQGSAGMRAAQGRHFGLPGLVWTGRYARVHSGRFADPAVEPAVVLLEWPDRLPIAWQAAAVILCQNLANSGAE